jgi:hypothetical protein
MILLLVLFLSLNNTISDITLREMYKTSTVNEETCKELFELLKKDNELNHSSTKLAFYGGTLSLMAFYSNNPIEKLKYSIEADKILDRSILLDPINFDGRSLRILYNAKVPSFLSDHNELNEDLVIFNSLVGDTQNHTLYNQWIISIINQIPSNSKL